MLLHFIFDIDFDVCDNFRSHNSSGGGKGNGPNNYNNNNFDQPQDYNTYGLSPSFLASLNIVGPLHTKVFVANVSIFICKFLLQIHSHSNCYRKLPFYHFIFRQIIEFI